MRFDSLDAVHAAFAVVLPLRVSWGDMDGLGHVNNTVYLRYFESTRILYFEKMALDLSSPSGLGPILASQTCLYRAPLTYPDQVHVGTRVSEIGADRFTMVFAIFSERLRRVAAYGDGVMVSYDYSKRQKVPMPEAWREAITRLEAR